MVYEYDNLVGKRIKAVRESMGMTQEQLAAKLQLNNCDITRSALAKIEVGQRHISLFELKVFCSVLKCDYKDLMV